MRNLVKTPASSPWRSMILAAAVAVTLPLTFAQAAEIPFDPQEVRALIAEVAKTDNIGKMKALLKEGLDINLQDTDGQPALVTAILAGHNDMVALLLDNHADVMTRTNKGMTALHAAAYVGNEAAAKMLIEHGAVVNDQANIARITPLHAAAEEDHLAVVKMLVAAGADPKRVEVNGYTAGSRAGWREHWDVVVFLLRSGDTCQTEDLAGAWLRDKCTHLDLSASN